MGLPSCERKIKPPYPKYTIWVCVQTSNFGVNLGFPHHLVSCHRTWVDMGMAQINYLPPKLDGSLEGRLDEKLLSYRQMSMDSFSEPFRKLKRSLSKLIEMTPKWLSMAQMDFKTKRLDLETKHGFWGLTDRYVALDMPQSGSKYILDSLCLGNRKGDELKPSPTRSIQQWWDEIGTWRGYTGTLIFLHDILVKHIMNELPTQKR